MITMANVVGRVAQRERLVAEADLKAGCLVDPLNPSAPPTRAAFFQCYFEAFVRCAVAVSVSSLARVLTCIPAQ